MDDQIDVEIDIFSGRPNPRFPVRGEEAKRLLDILDSSRRPMPTPPPEAGLGFRGFLVHVNRSDPATYRVMGDVLENAGSVFSDPDEEVQAYIVSIAPAALQPLMRPFLKAK